MGIFFRDEPPKTSSAGSSVKPSPRIPIVPITRPISVAAPRPSTGEPSVDPQIDESIRAALNQGADSNFVQFLTLLESLAEDIPDVGLRVKVALKTTGLTADNILDNIRAQKKRLEEEQGRLWKEIEDHTKNLTDSKNQEVDRIGQEVEGIQREITSLQARSQSLTANRATLIDELKAVEQNRVELQKAIEATCAYHAKRLTDLSNQVAARKAG